MGTHTVFSAVYSWREPLFIPNMANTIEQTTSLYICGTLVEYTGPKRNNLDAFIQPLQKWNCPNRSPNDCKGVCRLGVNAGF